MILTIVVYKYKALLHGDAITHKRCVLKEVVQREPKSKNDHYYMCGTINNDTVEDYYNLPKILACSIYDANTDILSTFTEKTAWTKNKNKNMGQV